MEEWNDMVYDAIKEKGRLWKSGMIWFMMQ